MTRKVKIPTCPNCKKKLKTVIEWQTCSMGYELDAETKELLDSTPEIVGGAHENTTCPICEFILPE